MSPAGATIVAGAEVAAALRKEVSAAAAELTAASGRTPRLDVLLVGGDPASAWYAAAKRKLGRRLGIEVRVTELAADTPAAAAADAVGRASGDPLVDGVIIELPLPAGIQLAGLRDRLDPVKDVDGITPANRAALFDGHEQEALVPATALACVRMIERCGRTIRGAAVAVVGRGPTVGRPVAAALINRHATVTVCHTRTRDLGAVLGEADVVVAAAGVPRLVTGAMIRPGAAVIDAGTNQVGDELVGDVEPESVAAVAGALTPVPGGVGTVTTAMIMANVMRAAEMRGVAA
ncbi:MAG: bifunctional 5,10-methylenetetrahydrofolate dehydrogenase/5,10-methenyltetrahydrofolate cyclohydrolase [Spirochaetaceae bacterium]|nr:bifunctional 5,10-methylenetetrahydrofolate dehydrogenase/5,10-methenyltetrahydrofolate cyclohydrolase [Spirochaetaceae bacterium]